MKYVKGATLDKSTMAESRKQKFAHVYENGRDFSESLKNRLTSLKKVDSLDTCTRTELGHEHLARGNRRNGGGGAAAAGGILAKSPYRQNDDPPPQTLSPY